MKAKQFLSALVLLCGILVLTGSKPAPRVNNDSKVWFCATGLGYSGNVDVRVVHNGETYNFSSLTALPNFLGEFRFTGNSFEMEITLHNNTPSLTRITTSPTLQIEEISTLKYRVRWDVGDENDRRLGGEIGIHFD